MVYEAWSQDAHAKQKDRTSRKELAMQMQRVKLLFFMGGTREKTLCVELSSFAGSIQLSIV